jgi:hypothetical protein
MQRKIWLMVTQSNHMTANHTQMNGMPQQACGEKSAQVTTSPNQ